MGRSTVKKEKYEEVGEVVVELNFKVDSFTSKQRKMFL